MGITAPHGMKGSEGLTVVLAHRKKYEDSRVLFLLPVEMSPMMVSSWKQLGHPSWQEWAREMSGSQIKQLEATG